MFVKMTWKEAEERFNKKQDFIMAGENPYKSMKFRARDFWGKWGSFMRVMEEVAALGGFACWQELEEDEEKEENRVFCAMAAFVCLPDRIVYGKAQNKDEFRMKVFKYGTLVDFITV